MALSRRRNVLSSHLTGGIRIREATSDLFLFVARPGSHSTPRTFMASLDTQSSNGTMQSSEPKACCAMSAARSAETLIFPGSKSTHILSKTLVGISSRAMIKYP